MNPARKFFQLRSMTKSLDDHFREDHELCKSLQSAHYPINQHKVDYDAGLLRDWEAYKRNHLRTLTQHALDSPSFILCLCDFLQGRRPSIEIWLKVAYDIFNDEADGRNFRMKFWNAVRRKAHSLELLFKNRRWPDEWRYLERHHCLNFEIIKLYEQYVPIRPFLAEHLNTLTTTLVDLRRMPFLSDERPVVLDFTVSTWLPRISIAPPALLKRLNQVENAHCEQLLRFLVQAKEILIPTLAMFAHPPLKGRVVNYYGREHDFMLEMLYSLKAVCGKSIRVTSGSLRVKKLYKTHTSMRINEDDCRIIVTSFSQPDVNEEVLQDISENLKAGYQAFGSIQNQGCEKRPRLVIILSQDRLSFKNLTNAIFYHKIPDGQICMLKRTFDYQFLVHYANLLFNKAMTVQQNCSTRKPFYQLMVCVWSYVFPMFFKDQNPSLAKDRIFDQLRRQDGIKGEDLTIELNELEVIVSSQDESSDVVIIQ